MSILVTGGTGYIGSHTVVELIKENEEVIIVDNLSNSDISVLDKIKEITGVSPKFYNVDLLNKLELEKIFEENNIEEVIHFAGLKAVGESVAEPLKYYNNNIVGTLNLLEAMNKYNCKKIVFSSSATVYGIPKVVPLTEECDLGTINPYGRTKLMIEEILKDTYEANKELSIVILRYFNPIGAHESGLIGDNPNGIPNNLMPYIVRVANGELEELKVFGNDYPTKDGTGVRDYIHVVDLAIGHIKAIQKARRNTGVSIYNLGTGNGYSVLEVINTFEKVNDVKVKYAITERRPGDTAECYADASKAKQELNWEATKGLEEMCMDAWNFVKEKK